MGFPGILTMICSVIDCGRRSVARGWCGKHYQAWAKHGDPCASKAKRADFTGCPRKDGYVIVQRSNVKRLAHVEIAEKALGKPLPQGAIVHHADEDPSNNSPSNLVICPNQVYHMLLHRRARALDACGNADWLKCCICKQWDSPTSILSRAGKNVHKSCEARVARERRASIRQASTKESQ